MKINLFLIIFILLFSSNQLRANEFLTFEEILNDPTQITKELKKIQQQRKNNENIYSQSHQNKIEKLSTLFQEKALLKRVIVLHQLAVTFKWNKTIQKTENLKRLCTFEINKGEQCLEEISNIREFLLGQDLHQDKVDIFFNKTDLLEDSAIEFNDLLKDFSTYYNEEVTYLNSLKSDKKFIKQNNLKLVTPDLENQNMILLSLTALILMIILFNFKKFKNNLMPKFISFYIKRKWLQNLQNQTNFNLTGDDLKLIKPYFYEIEKLTKTVKNRIKQSAIMINPENKNFLTIELSFPNQSSIMNFLDDESVYDIKNAILKLDTSLGIKDKIQITDVYGKSGLITSNTIKIFLAKAVSH